MIKAHESTQIFICSAATDMRKSINGLSALVDECFSQSAQSRNIFIFYNEKKNKVKLIFWDRNGFVLYYKRLEKGRFKINKSSDDKRIEINKDQLSWLLAGLDFQLMDQFNELNYTNYY